MVTLMTPVYPPVASATRLTQKQSNKQNQIKITAFYFYFFKRQIGTHTSIAHYPCKVVKKKRCKECLKYTLMIFAI